jgi:hypothetical protein
MGILPMWHRYIVDILTIFSTGRMPVPLLAHGHKG